MAAAKNPTNKRVKDPTKKQIKARSEKIQQEWSEKERAKRCCYKIDDLTVKMCYNYIDISHMTQDYD